jgi:hypothetical protein
VWRTDLLKIPVEAAPSDYRANAMLWTGSTSNSFGDMTGARRWLVAAVAMARAVGDYRATAWIVHRASRFAGPTPEEWFGASRWELGEEALELYRSASDGWGISMSLAWLGNLAFHGGNLDLARRLLDESVETARAVGERYCVAYALRYRGEALSNDSDSQATADLTEGRRLYHELGDVQGGAYIEYLLGRLHCLHHRYDLASLHFRAGLLPFKDFTWLEMVARSLNGLAMVAAGLETPARALRLAAASARLSEEAAVEISQVERAELNQALASARQVNGDARSAEAWTEGQAMTWEEAVAYAVVEDRTPSMPV